MILSKILTFLALVPFCREGHHKDDDDDDATVVGGAAGCPQPLHQSLCTT